MHNFEITSKIDKVLALYPVHSQVPFMALGTQKPQKEVLIIACSVAWYLLTTLLVGLSFELQVQSLFIRALLAIFLYLYPGIKREELH